MTVNPSDFDKKYALIASTTGFSQEKSLPRCCRFCNKEEGATTFYTDAHAVSEFLGANDLISWEECDKCNKEFGKYESHLSKFLQPHITINGIKGKNGVPTFQSRSINGDRDTHTKFTFEELNRLALTIGVDGDCKISQEAKTFSIKFRIPAHKPLFAYKALVKIALSLLPSSKVKKYSSLYDWLQDRCRNPNILSEVIITTMRKKRFSGTHCDLYEVRSEITADGILPELTLVIRFGNVIAQIFLPFTPERLANELPSQNLEINLSTAHLFNNDFNTIAQTGIVEYDFRTIDLSSPDTVMYDQVMHFTYQELISSLRHNN